MIEQRKYPMYPSHFRLNLTCEDGSSWDVSTIDISIEGMRILSKDKNLLLEPSSLVTIKLQKQHNIEPLLFSGVVKHYSLEQNGDTIFGVEVTPRTEQAKKNWDSVVEKVRLSMKQ